MRYLTKDWYLLCQTWPMPDGVKKQINDTVAAYNSAQALEDISPSLLKKFMFHDGVVLIASDGEDFVIEIDSPYSEYHKITFRGAIVEQDGTLDGATWIYEELYRRKSGPGYEAHILFDRPQSGGKMNASTLCELKITCEDLLFA